jgi:septal ring-binding cell division protein DamX
MIKNMNHRLLLTILFFLIPITTLSQVLQLDTTLNGEQLKVTWNNIIASDGYHLYYSKTPFKRVKNIPYIDVGNVTKYNYKLSAGDRYYMAVSAHVGGENLTLSNIALVDIPAKKLELEAPLLTTAVIKQTAYLQWSNIKLATDYWLYYSNLPFKSTSGITRVKVGNTTSFSKFLAESGDYYVAVVAAKDDIHSHLSNIEQLHINVNNSTVTARNKDNKYNNTSINSQESKLESVIVSQPISGLTFRKRIKKENILQQQKTMVQQKTTHSIAKKTVYAQDWINKQLPTSYSIQIMSSTRKKDLDAFIQSYPLVGDIAYKERMVNETKWYSIIYGVYPTGTLARKAVENLPQSILPKKPWVRSFKQLQTSQ